MSSTDIFYAIRFWLVLTAIGIAGLPFAYRLFHKLPDRGYAFSKMTGLVMTTFSFWLIASYGLTSNSVGGIVFGLLIFVGVSVWLYQKTDQQLWIYIKENIGYVLTVELLFTVLFFTWAWVRAQNPQISATEKPMEFAFLNSVTNSPTYPPLDPWLSGFAISYYYMGYIMMSVVGRLAAVPMSITFNLTVAWLVAGSGVGAFGLVYNLTTLITEEKERISAAANLAVRRNAIILGLVAAIAIPLAGNNQMMLEILHGNGIGGEGFWAWLDVRDIDEEPGVTPRFQNSDGSLNGSWWWWRSSRVIEEYNLSGLPGLEPIAEFPGFSFVLGDIHPHVLAMPYIFLIVAFALTWYLDDREWIEPEEENFVPWLQSLAQNMGLEKMVIAAIFLGGLAFTNTWDLPIHLFVVMSAFALNRWSRTGRFDAQSLSEVIVVSFATIILIFIIYYPFFSGLNSQAGAPFIMPMLVQPTRMVHFLIIFGTPIFVILCMLVVLGRNQTREGNLRAALSIGLGLPLFLMVLSLFLTWIIGSLDLAPGYYSSIINEMALQIPGRTGPTDFGWGAAFLTSLLPRYFLLRFTFIGVTLMLGFILGGIVWLWTGQLNEKIGTHKQTIIPFLLLLIFTGTLLTLGPEYVYLKDNFNQRINTIFKFYYQAWILFGSAALVSLGYLLKNTKITGYAAAGVYTLLFVFAIRFPIVGAQTRGIEFRGPVSSENRREATLDGLVFMQYQNPSDYDALMWLKSSVEADDVILETTGGAYSYYGRVSANTGLPTLLGWANHENQWRGTSTDQIGIRNGVIREIYDTRDWDRASVLLNEFEVSYIYVGQLEKQDHDPRGLEKFENNLEVAYANDGVTIYRWK